MDAKRTGTFIAKIRSEKEMTQKELANILQVTDKAISRWETGKGFPDISLLKPLSDALGVSVSELLSGERIAAESQTEKAETMLLETLSEKKDIATKLLVFVFLLIGIGLLISPLYVSSFSMSWVLGVALLSVCAVIFLATGKGKHNFFALSLFLQIQALLWEMLPFGAILIFQDGPSGPSTVQTYSYFSLFPLGYANFAPILTAIMTIICLILGVSMLLGRWKEHPMKKRKSAAFLCNVFAIFFSVVPLFLFGTHYMNGASYAITLLLASSVILPKETQNTNPSH